MEQDTFLERFLYKSLPIVAQRRHFDNQTKERLQSDKKFKKFIDHIFKVKNKIYLLYNGNDFGKIGFGIAELIES
jgi:hypothetical protein